MMPIVTANLIRPTTLLFVGVLILGGLAPGVRAGGPEQATTTLNVSVCGDAIVQSNEICDDGINDGEYALSSSTRDCAGDCLSFGPYCGDGVLQVLFGEECDDGNNVSGDLCDFECNNEVAPTTDPGGTGESSGGGGGGGGSSGGGGDPDGTDDGTVNLDDPTEVLISGIAYPGATVNILLDGEIDEVVEADSDGEFSLDYSGLTPGATTFGFWAQDSEGRRSITFSTTFEIIQSAVTNVSGILIPPTIAVEPDQVPLGTSITVRGEAPPERQVTTLIDNGDLSATTTSAANGAWLLSFETRTLANESFHTAKANYRAAAAQSGYSQLVNFYVGVRDVDTSITPDINQDGRVDLIDFSIFLFNWQTTNAIADFNQDGTVGLPDFSIMLFAWTG